jgi:hypothetical protein
MFVYVTAQEVARIIRKLMDVKTDVLRPFYGNALRDNRWLMLGANALL